MRPQPLGRAYWRLQAAMLVSALADACIIIIPIYWILVRQGLDLSTAEGLAAARDETQTVLTWVPLARMVSQPLLAPLADALPRGRVLSVALLLRASPWVTLAILSVQEPVSARTLGMLCAGAALSGLADTAALALVPRIVPPTETERALALAAGLPRAGFFLSVVVGLIVVVLLDVRATLLLGAGLLVVAAVACGSFPEHGAAGGGRRAWSPLGVVAAGRGPLALCGLAALANFAVYPLYWVGPAIAGRSDASGDNLEVAIVVGSLLGLLALGVLARLPPARAIGGSLLALGLALAALAAGRATIAVGVVLGAAFAASNLLLAARAIAQAPDAVRARVAGLFGAACAGAGELGARVVEPALAGGAIGWLPLALGAPIALAGFVLWARRPAVATGA